MLDFLAALLVSTAITDEYANGTWNRAIIAGVKIHHFIICHFIQAFVVLISQMMLFSPFTYIFTDAKELLPFLFLNTVYLVCGIYGISIGVLYSCFATAKTLIWLNNSLFFIKIYTGGFYWPIEGQATILRYFSVISPFCKPAIAATHIAFKNAGIDNPKVLNNFMVMFVWILVNITFSLIILKYNSRK